MLENAKFAKIFKGSFQMKKLLAMVIFFGGFIFCLVAEKISKKETIDNVFSVEWMLDTDSGNVEIDLFSVNTDAYDESFGDSCIEEKLYDIISEHGYSESSVISSSKDDNFKGMYTKVVRKYKLQ